MVLERADRAHEIHLARENDKPAERRYFDDAWQRAVSDRLVDAARRDRYDSQLQRPENLCESPR